MCELGLLTRVTFFYLNEMTRSSPALFEKKKSKDKDMCTKNIVLLVFVKKMHMHVRVRGVVMHPNNRFESSSTQIWVLIFFLMKNRLTPPRLVPFFTYSP